MNSIYRMPLILSVLGVSYYGFMLWIGDIIPVNAGMGYDGVNSATYSQNVYFELIETTRGTYTFQKSLSWFVLGVVYWFISLFSGEFAAALATNNIATVDYAANPSIALGSWFVINSLCLVIGLVFWAKLLDRFKIIGRTAILSYFLLVLSVGNFRMAGFYTTLADMLFFAFGVVLLHIYFSVKPRRLLTILGFFSGFLRSNMNILVAVLVAYPYEGDRHTGRSKATGERWNPGIVAAASSGLVLTMGLVYFGLYKEDTWVQTGMMSFRWLASILIVLPVVLGMYHLFKPYAWNDFIPKLQNLKWAAAVIVSVFIVLKLLAGANDLPLPEYFRRSLLTALIYPGQTMVSHVAYFGPGIILLVFLWSRVSTVLQEFGIGIVLFIGLGLALSIMPESRTITHFIPTLFLALTIVLSRMERDLPSWGYVALPVLSFFSSKMWMLMRWPEGRADHYAFPEQLYFMNIGPWMSGESLIIQGLAGIIATGIVAAWLYDFRLGRSKIPPMDDKLQETAK